MHALYPGSFDPVTRGHLDLIGRAAGMFGKLTVAIGRNSRKGGVFSEDERIALLEAACARWENVTIGSFTGLIVDHALKIGADVLVRGLRNCSDFEFEATMAVTNRALKGVETVFLTADPRYAYTSSTLVKEIVTHGGDASAYVPEDVHRALRAKLLKEDPT